MTIKEKISDWESANEKTIESMIKRLQNLQEQEGDHWMGMVTAAQNIAQAARENQTFQTLKSSTDE